MKFFFVLNLYSSFQKIIKEKKLIEVGNISLIKLIKKISINNNCCVILLDKNLEISKKNIKSFNIKKISFYVVPFNFSFKRFNIIRNLISIFFLIRKFLLSKKCSIYTDRGNIILAFFLKNFTSNFVIIRILGITNKIEESLRKRSIFSWITKIIWKKKFDLIIHSNDGSNFRFFDQKYLNKKNKKLVLNQAVEKKKFKSKKIISKKFKILLSDNFKSEYKNLNQIIFYLNNIDFKLKKKVFLIVVFSNKIILKKIKNSLRGFHNIKYIKKLDYLSLLNLKNDTDALLTFNSMGYLSNNIIESICYNNWIITPKYSKNYKRIPKKFLENFIFLDPKNFNNSFNTNLSKLIHNKKKIFFKYKNIKSNEEKVNIEFEKLKSLKFIN